MSRRAAVVRSQESEVRSRKSKERTTPAPSGPPLLCKEGSFLLVPRTHADKSVRAPTVYSITPILDKKWFDFLGSTRGGNDDANNILSRVRT